MIILAYLPQHVFESGCVLMAACFGLSGWVALVRQRAVRQAALSAILAAGLLVAALTVDAEPPCARCLRSGHWGGSFGIGLLVLWSLLVIALTWVNLRRRW
jgi:hypothetical protein